MKILLHSSGHVDLEAPISMTAEQFAVFSAFFRDNFPGIEFVDRIEKIKNTGSRDGESKDWTLEEYLILLGPLHNSEIAVKLGRTDMSVKMKRGQFVPDFFVWMKKKGYSLPVETKIISNYFREMGEA